MLYLQLSIVIHEEVLVGHEQLEADELEAAVLEAGDDAAHEAALYAVRLDHDVRPLHHGLGRGQKIRKKSADRRLEDESTLLSGLQRGSQLREAPLPPLPPLLHILLAFKRMACA